MQIEMASVLELISLKFDNEIQKYANECIASDVFSGMNESEKSCVAFELHHELSSAGLLELWSNFMNAVYVGSNEESWIQNDMLEDSNYADYIDWQKVDEILYRDMLKQEESSFNVFDYDS